MLPQNAEPIFRERYFLAHIENATPEICDMLLTMYRSFPLSGNNEYKNETAGREWEKSNRHLTIKDPI